MTTQADVVLAGARRCFFCRLAREKLWPAKRRGSLGPAGSLVSTGLELGQMPEEPAPADDDSGAQALGRVALNDAARPGGPKAGDGGGSNDSERALETPQDLDMPPRLIPSSTHSNLGTPVGTPRQDLSAPPACLPSMSSEDIFDGSGRDSLRLEPNDEDSLRDMYGDPDEQLVVHEEAPKRRRISLDEMTPRPSVQLEMSEAGGPGWPPQPAAPAGHRIADDDDARCRRQ